LALRPTPAQLKADKIKFASVELPKQQRQTRIVKDTPVDEIAKEIVAWIKG
jgi:electron transfer flavoprotein beta subunit